LSFTVQRGKKPIPWATRKRGSALSSRKNPSSPSCGSNLVVRQKQISAPRGVHLDRKLGKTISSPDGARRENQHPLIIMKRERKQERKGSYLFVQNSQEETTHAARRGGNRPRRTQHTRVREGETTIIRCEEKEGGTNFLGLTVCKQKKEYITLLNAHP